MKKNIIILGLSIVYITNINGSTERPQLIRSLSEPAAQQQDEEIVSAIMPHFSQSSYFNPSATTKPYPVPLDLSSIDKSSFRTSALVRLFYVKAFDKAEESKQGDAYVGPMLSRKMAQEILDHGKCKVTTIKAAIIKSVAINHGRQDIKDVSINVDFANPGCLDLCRFGEADDQEAGKKALQALRRYELDKIKQLAPSERENSEK